MHPTDVHDPRPIFNNWRATGLDADDGGWRLWSQIVEDWRAHGRDWTRPGLRAVAVHRFGNWRNRIRWKLVRAPLSVIYRCLYRHVRNHYGIELHFTVKLGRRVVIEHQGCIVIHPFCEIGDDCVIRQGVTLGIRDEESDPMGTPTLGKRVSIGAGAKLLGAILVGDDAKIGANAVVLTDVPAGATAVGVPARLILPRAEAEAEADRWPVGRNV